MNIKVNDTVKTADGRVGVVGQITKAGMYIVYLKDGTNARVAKKTLELLQSYNPEENPFPTWTLAS